MHLSHKFLTIITLILALFLPGQTTFAQWFSANEYSFDSGYYMDEDGALVEQTFDDSGTTWATNFETPSFEWDTDFAAPTIEWESEFDDTNDNWGFENEFDTTWVDTAPDWADADSTFEEWEFETPSFEWDTDIDFENPWDDDNDTPPEEDDEGEEIVVPLNCPLTATQLASITNFPPQDGPIVAFGDSLTAGVGATFGQDYVSELELLTGENIINAGVSGDTTEEALARLNRDVLSYNPSTVIVWLGGNDFLARYYQEIENQTQGTFLERLIEAFFEFIGKNPRNESVITEDETFANLETIVERIQDTGAVVVLVGMDGEPVEDNLNGRYEEVAEDTGAIFVSDVLDGIIGRPSLTSDLIHPNNPGYELVARRIYPAVACTL